MPTLLIIDDSADIHALLEARLRPEALHIEHAYGGLEGIEAAIAAVPDLVLLDVEMPHLSGLDVCRRLKELPETAGVPIIFLTGSADVATKVHGFDLGAVDYVTKPFEPAELRARVRAALRTKRYQDLLATRASLDGLTGLLTRGCFDTRFPHEHAAARAAGRPFSLVLLDVDHFKTHNDLHGHPFGDRLLQAIGETMLAARREGESAYRYGGDEFAVLLPGLGAREACGRASALLDALRRVELVSHGQAIGITASLGVASATPDGTAATLLAAADQALYASKHAGRGRVTVAAAA